MAIWDGAPKTGIDMFFLVQERLWVLNGMMGFVLCELLGYDVELLQGHGIYKHWKVK